MSCFSDSDSRAAIILAGGQSSRIGSIGKVFPKCMLPLSGDETLLTRILKSFEFTSIKRVIISTSPVHYSLLASFAAIILESNLLAFEISVNVISNNFHANGPCPALGIALRHCQEYRSLLIILSDICYLDLDVSLLNSPIDPDKMLLLVGPIEPGRGGVVQCREGIVKKISYAQEEDCSLNSDQFYCWSGGLIVGACLAKRLESICVGLGETHLESIIDACIQDNIEIRVIYVGDFVNTNRWSDYQKLC